MAKNLIQIVGDESVEILGNDKIKVENLAFKLDDVKPNSLYFSLKSDADEIAKAIKSGAVAIVCEKKFDVDIPQICVQNIRSALSIFSINFYDRPSEKLKLIGVTGTNGKTTTTYILKSILSSANKKVGVIGTNGYVIGANIYPLSLTTPDPIQLQEILSQMVKAECEYVVMEVSAHALFFDKIYGMRFEAGIFTNLTQDHLDFFGSMENYAKCKAKFFSDNYINCAIINIDDDFGKTIFSNAKVSQIYSFGLNEKANVFAFDILPSLKGTFFKLKLFEHRASTHFEIPGLHNIYNVLGASACAYQLGIEPYLIVKGIENIQNVSGRFEIYSLYNDAYAIVDYAHTPDGIDNILNAVRSLCSGKIITVFGCGGNRDKTKRAIMGKIAGEKSDYCIITSDNPRHENPLDIIAEIEKGIKQCGVGYECVENRKQAITQALQMAQNDDCVVICGKGAENYQEIMGVKYHFSDREIVQEWNKKQQKLDYQAFEK